MPIIGEDARVLITVKASPQPSAKYGDTVCVAGIRLDRDSRDWIRLYPIPFRYLASEQQFKKYDIVDLTVRRNDKDPRRESYSPEWESIKVVDHLDGWARRAEIMNDVPVTTACQLREDTISNPNGPSLGFADVLDVSALTFEAHPGWSAADRQKINNALSQVDLFGDFGSPPRLEAPRFKVRYRYRCTHSSCPGHNGQILDWELTELQRRLRQDADAEAKRKITAKFLTMMCDPKRQTRFFMGNFAAAIKRDKFSVLGVYYPERSIAARQSLF